MEQLLSAMPVAKATAGTDKKGNTLSRVWGLVVVGEDHLVADELVAQCRTAAEVFLREVGLTKAATVELVGAAMARCAGALSLRLRGAAGGAAASALRVGFLETGDVSPSIDYSALVDGTQALTLYELMSQFAISRARSAALQWSGGRLLEVVGEVPEMKFLSAQQFLEPPSQEVALAMALHLVGEMFHYRTAFPLQISVEALTAGEIPSGVIEQVALGTNRVRKGAASAVAPFGLPRYDLYALPAYKASLAAAADDLFLGTPQVDGFLRQVRNHVTSLVDEVLECATQLTMLQMKIAPTTEQEPFRNRMLNQRDQAAVFLQEVKEVAHTRLPAAPMAETCFIFLASECSAADLVITVQDSFTNKDAPGYRQSNKEAFIGGLNELSTGLLHMLTQLQWARYGFPKMPLEVADMPFHAPLEQWRLKRDSVTNPGPGREFLAGEWKNRQSELLGTAILAKAPGKFLTVGDLVVKKPGLSKLGKVGASGIMKSGGIGSGGG